MCQDQKKGHELSNYWTGNLTLTTVVNKIVLVTF